jgi:RNA polymerase sigma-70 factor (ECF subfamily)
VVNSVVGIGQQDGVMSDQLDPNRPPPVAVEQAATVAGWFDRHVDTIHRYVARRAGDEVARDLTAETFRIAFERFDRYDPNQGSERAWLYGIATNLLRRHWRSEQRRLRAHVRHATVSEAVAGDPLVGAETRIDAQRRLRHVVDVIEQLDPDDRDLLILVAVGGCTSAEAGRALDLPAGTVRSRLNRIRAQLRTQGATR